MTKKKIRLLCGDLIIKVIGFLNLSTKRFQKLMDGFKSVASDLYSSGNYYYITIDTSKKESIEDKSYEVEIEELKKK